MKIEDILKELGFERIGVYWQHPLRTRLNSAHLRDVDELACWIFDQGEKSGRINTQREIKESLGL